jgi:hypothetical protein
MQRAMLDSICKQVYHQFPQVNGVTPKVTKQEENFLLVFSTKVQTADNRSLPVTVRVVADASGKIIKTSTSR